MTENLLYKNHCQMIAKINLFRAGDIKQILTRMIGPHSSRTPAAVSTVSLGILIHLTPAALS